MGRRYVADVTLCQNLCTVLAQVTDDKECKVRSVCYTVLVYLFYSVDSQFVDVGLIEKLRTRIVVGRDHHDGVLHDFLRQSGLLLYEDSVTVHQNPVSQSVEPWFAESEVKHLHHGFRILGSGCCVDRFIEAAY